MQMIIPSNSNMFVTFACKSITVTHHRSPSKGLISFTWWWNCTGTTRLQTDYFLLLLIFGAAGTYLDVFLQVEIVSVVFQVLQHVLGRDIRLVLGPFVRESWQLHDFFRQIRSKNEKNHRNGVMMQIETCPQTSGTVYIYFLVFFSDFFSCTIENRKFLYKKIIRLTDRSK